MEEHLPTRAPGVVVGTSCRTPVGDRKEAERRQKSVGEEEHREMPGRFRGESRVVNPDCALSPPIGSNGVFCNGAMGRSP